MRVFKEYEITVEDQREAIKEWLERKLKRKIEPKNIYTSLGQELTMFMQYREVEKITDE